MGLLKQAAMEKRAVMQEFMADAKKQLLIKYNGATVNQALQEILVEDMKEMVKTAFPHDPQPVIELEVVGTAAVRFRVHW